MSVHSHTRLLVHIIWSTHRHEKLINQQFCVPLNHFFTEYCHDHSIRLIVSYVNADHVHLLIDLNADQSTASVVKLLKGASSRWFNQQEEQYSKFSWKRGYGAFSVSESNIQAVIKYINNQGKHHRIKSFREEFERFSQRYQVERGNR